MNENEVLKAKTVYKNLSHVELIEHAIINKEGKFCKQGALITNTGKYTGRSPNDKFTVIDDQTKDIIWFNEGNKPMKPEHAENLYQKVIEHLSKGSCYVSDLKAGASKHHWLKVRITTECAWHSLFAKNMFIDLGEHEKEAAPDFHLFHAPSFLANPKRDNTKSEAAVIIDFTKKRVVICGTRYAGEIKKSIFTVLNFLLPNKGVLGMHCSANKNDNNESALFFGLSGTGKTTLSAEGQRSLIGDDEHGWDDEGVFNFEGGCYAKVIKLSKKDEPEIYEASQKFGSILENVVYDEKTRELDLDSNKYTENTRASYDISYIPNACLTRVGKHPNNIIMLTCDAFGVLPPLAKLDEHAATYHFINGYTAKVAGTERGVKEPKAVFSACFGAPFMAHFPKVYAHLLKEKIRKHNVKCWLVNTGWTGGPYGEGSRMKISWTRRLLHAALDGELDNASFVKNEVFNLMVPKAVADVPNEILQPELTWKDKDAYFRKAKKLVELFHNNFKLYEKDLPSEIKNAGPKGTK